MVRAYLFDKYFTNIPSVVEFGCGTGHNLLALAKQQPGKVVFGLDWSRQALEHVKKLVEQGITAYAFEFDLLNPTTDFLFPGQRALKSGVLTVGALEQIGKKFENFLCFLLSRQPPVIIRSLPLDRRKAPRLTESWFC